MAKITGIGGVFLKAKSDHKALSAWYEKNLGMTLESYGAAILKWTEDHAEDKGATVWTTAAPDSDWFSPSTSSFMINYRVDDMAGMIEQLRRNEVPLVKGPEFHENGAFAWLIDPDGNKIELWEPKNWDDKNKR